jgi:hypothetical protein
MMYANYRVYSADYLEWYRWLFDADYPAKKGFPGDYPWKRGFAARPELF